MASLPSEREENPIVFEKVRKCLSHTDKDITMSCDTYNDQLVYTKCVATIHKSHAFSELEDIVRKRRLSLTEFVEFAGKHLDNLRTVLTSLKNLKDAIEEDSQAMEQRIKKRMDEIGEQLNEIKTNIDEDYKSKEKQIVDTLETRKEFVSSLMDEITNVKSQCQRVLDSPCIWDIINHELHNDLTDKCNSELAQIPHVPQYQLATYDLEKAPYNKMFGELTDDSESPSLPPKLKITSSKETKYKTPTTLKEFKLPFGGINSISIINQNEAWISYIGSSAVDGLLSSTIHRVTCNGDVLSTIEIPSPVFCLMQSSNNSLLVSCKDKTINGITPDGSTSVLFECHGNPVGFCEADNDDAIVVCLRDKGRVVKYSNKGKVLLSVGSCLKMPSKVSVNKGTGEMVVIDKDPGMTERRLLVLDASMKLLWIFDSSLMINTPIGNHELFIPNQVCYDCDGNILTVMPNTQGGFAIKICAEKQQFLSYKWLGYKTPYSIAQNNQIWIGFNKGDVFILQDV